MCGIAGIYNTEISDKNTDMQLMNAIMADQENRGPDNQTVLQIDAKNVTSLFGHNRLAIIDLSPVANQPMWDAENEFCIVFNGQIYNYIELKDQLIKLQYHFVTQSDTEVILRAFKHWRERCVEYFNGMFSFAILEKKTGQMWIFRDRFGIKPLYYLIKNNKLVFASSSNVLAKKYDLKPNADYLFQGKHYKRYEDGTAVTAYHGLSYLPGGHYLSAKLYGSELRTIITSYYSLQDRTHEYQQKLLALTHTMLCEYVFDQMSQAVNIRLRSDVPFGITLSSGLDSSSIAALIRDRHPKHTIAAFSFGSPAIHTTEAPLVATLSQQLNINTHYVMPSPQEFTDAFWQTLTAQDAPFPSCSVIAQYLVYQAARQQGVKVLLGGQGADETFLGYKKFQFYYLKQIFKQKNYARILGQMSGMFLSFLHYLPQYKQFTADIYRYCQPDRSRVQLTGTSKNRSGTRSSKTLFQYASDDIFHFSLPTLLRYEDRNSMANSVESRLPFLDYNLVELALSLPDAIKIKYGYGKWIMRHSMKNHLPRSIRMERLKRGFDAGDAYWIDRGLGDSLRDALQSQQADLTDYLPKNVNINQYFSNTHLKSHPNTFAEIVSLLWLATKRI